MSEFLATLIAFPTVVFSFLLIPVVLYWLFVLIGAVDLDVFDLDIDTDAAKGAEGIAGIFFSLGLTGVPVMVVLSLLVLWAWMLTYLSAIYLLPWLPAGGLRIIGGLASIGVAGALSLLLTARLVRPLRPLFLIHVATDKRTLVGKLCTVTTLRVDNRFGQAEYDDGAAGLIIAVRCEDSKVLTKGKKALIIEYDAQVDSYEVMLADDSL